MSPEAAGLFAQIDAAILIALAVQRRPPAKPAVPEEPGDEDFPRRLWQSLGYETYSGGLLATIFALFMTLESVKYDKPLSPWSSSVVTALTFLGAGAFFMTAAGDAIGTLRSLRQRLRLVAVMLACFVAFSVWLLTFAPSLLPWK
jgi:hypothetical protein